MPLPAGAPKQPPANKPCGEKQKALKLKKETGKTLKQKLPPAGKNLKKSGKISMEYSRALLQTHRPQSMYDSEAHSYITELTKSGENFADHPDKLFQSFKDSFHHWLLSSRLNSAKGLEAFPDRDIILGVTQYLDDLHMTKKSAVVLENEYKYHWRLFGDSLKIKKPARLEAGDQLIISLPFSYYGDIHPEMESVLAICNEKNIPVHIDGCWFGCSRDIKFNFDQPCIQSAGFSLSKALGLGANRIGLRYCRRRWKGPVAVMNDFNMNIQAPVWIGLKFMRKFGADFWQKKYGEAYKKVCGDFQLRPTKAIHLAFDKNQPVGLRPLLRRLVK